MSEVEDIVRDVRQGVSVKDIRRGRGGGSVRNVRKGDSVRDIRQGRRCERCQRVETVREMSGAAL